MNAGIRVQFGTVTAEQIGFGVKRQGLLEISVINVGPGRVRMMLRNTGRPEMTATAFPGGDRIEIEGVGLGVPPGGFVEWGAERGVTNTGLVHDGLQIHVALDASSYRPHSSRFAATKPWLEGGQSVWWDVVDGSEPEPARTGPLADWILTALGHYGIDAADYPRLAQLRALWTLTPGSFPNLGDWLQNWHVRFTANSNGTTRLPSGKNWYDWGGTIEAADGHTNSRYDVILWCVERFLTTGDAGALHAARLLAAHRAQAGFVWTDMDVPEVTHESRYETGFQQAPLRGKCGDQYPPRHSHKWWAGFFAVAQLTKDPTLLRVCELVSRKLCSSPANLKLHYGGRSFGWHLWNLWCCFKITGEQRFKNAATLDIAKLWSLVPAGDTHWPDAANPSDWWPWQECLLNTTLMMWGHESVGLEHGERLLGFMRYAIDNGTRILQTPIGPALQTAMQRGTKDVWQGPSLSAFALPVTWVLAKHDPSRLGTWEAAVNAVVGCAFQQWSNVSPVVASTELGIWPSAHGFAALKIHADVMYGARPCWLVHP